jgi:chemotaxis protein MotB
MPRQKRHEEHTNHEAWAIPYGDLITLLLAFFVVMYALSSVNEGKYRLLSDSLYAAFRGTPRTMEPVQVGEQDQVGPGADSHAGPLQQNAPTKSASAPVETVKLAANTPQLGNVPHETSPDLPSPAARAALAHVADQLESAMADLIQKNIVGVRRNDLWVEVEIRSDLLFPSGSARLATNAVTVLEQLAQVLAPLPNAVRVEGHTDNVPIRNANFYSNWELSAARAGSVVHVLSGHGVAPNRLAVVGFGEQRPSHSNDTAQGRNANRRVVVVILASDPAHANDPLGMLSTAAPATPSSTPTEAPASATTTPVATTPVATTPVATTPDATATAPNATPSGARAEPPPSGAPVPPPSPSASDRTPAQTR